MTSALCVACRTRGSGMVAIYQHPNGLDQMFTSVTGIEVEHGDFLCIPCYDDMKAAHLFKQKCIQNNILRVSRPSTLRPRSEDEDQKSDTLVQQTVEVISPKTEIVRNSEISTTISDTDILEEHLVIRPDISDAEREEHQDRDAELLEEDETNDKKVTLRDILPVRSSEPNVANYTNDIEPSSYEAFDGTQDAGSVSDESQSIRCEVCGKTFEKLQFLHRHMKVCHPAAESTDECGEQQSPGALATLPTVHNLMCEYCFQEFTVPAAKYEHETQHMSEPKPYKCPHCQGTFKDKVGLRSHIRIHSAVKRYKCQYCEMRFHQRGNLTAHERTHVGAKPYLCPQCGKGFAESGNLKNHIRYHTGERPYACSECPKRFRTHYSRTVHYRAHSNERPFRCTECDKGFYSSGKLIIHRRVHSGEKPYKCSSCPAKFADSSGLKRHSKTH
ncbi:zinc finger protein 502-like [Armigeres subalbatus]|uniref:zinc finger protein 502-like n=1 Tax=Armigeres subalbatus TaxID=124917 RepID=UPI002ED50D45